MKSKHKLLNVLCCIAIVSSCFCPIVAEENKSNPYTLDSDPMDAGKDTGYSKTEKITKGNPHWGWSLGEFVVSGFSGTDLEGESPIFLKNSGDKIRLDFNLDQKNISKLNDDSSMSICNDTDGYDNELGQDTPENGFGYGTLFIKHSNIHNNEEKPQIYTSYLKKIANDGNSLDDGIEINEEGDYDVYLDYEIKTEKKMLFLKYSQYNDYRIHCSFSVQNSNNMFFLRELNDEGNVGSELYSGSSTKNGFVISTANSDYLNIEVKREVLNDMDNDLIEDCDTRFNKIAKDGDKYEEEGIYTITSTKNQISEPTVKTIYVGTNKLLTAYAKYKESKGYDIADIRQKMEDGYNIENDGTLKLSNEQTETSSYPANVSSSSESEDTSDASKATTSLIRIVRENLLQIIFACLATIACIWFVIYNRRKIAKQGKKDKEAK